MCNEQYICQLSQILWLWLNSFWGIFAWILSLKKKTFLHYIIKVEDSLCNQLYWNTDVRAIFACISKGCEEKQMENSKGIGGGL